MTNIMNNTKTLAIVAILTAATLVVGVTLAYSNTISICLSRKRKTRERTRKEIMERNGNTVTIQKCKQKGSVSGFDNTAEQESQNVICTHPSCNLCK